MTAPAHLRLVQTAIDEHGEIVTGCPGCNAARDEAEIWEGRVLTLERQLKQALEDKDAKLRNDKDYINALGLFEEWKTETGHPNAKPDPRRIQLAIRAVKLYRKHREQLSWVIQYGKHFAYVDEKGIKHDSFGLLFRDAEHIERYANSWARRRHEVTS